MLVAAGSLLFGTASARAAKEPPCRRGRFVVHLPDAPIIVGGGAASATRTDALIIEGTPAKVSIGSGCPPAPVRLRGTRRGTTVVSARWRTCGELERARVKATIDAECRIMTGVFTATRSRQRVRKPFTSAQCGDGVNDVEVNEECDGSIGCGAGEQCSADCECWPLLPPPTDYESSTP